MCLRKMRKYKFSYDKDSDDLFLYRANTKSKGSVETGNLVLDFNAKKELVGIQFINATKFIKDLIGEKVSELKDLFSSLKECRVDITKQKNMLFIKVFLISDKKEIQAPLMVSTITESSPAAGKV